jgi:thiamine biosynthesis lipoprotein
MERPPDEVDSVSLEFHSSRPCVSPRTGQMTIEDSFPRIDRFDTRQSHPGDPPVMQRTLYNKGFRAMGGTAQLRFVDDRGIEIAESLARQAMAEVDRIERKYSRFLESSLISRINRDAGRTPVAVDNETIGLVETALRLADLTGGAFDPTVGVLRRAWNFREARVPSEQELSPLLELVDYRQVSVADGTVFLRRAGMELDLGGIGKEYAVDRVASLLKDAGVESAIVNLAGDVRCIRARGDGVPWKIGVVDPRRKDRCPLRL